jgi:hypothetical protein
MKYVRYAFSLLTLFFTPLLLAAKCGGELNLPSVSVSPKTQTVTMGGAAIKLSATLANSSAAVLWTLKGEGSLSNTKGVSVDYTPPATIAAETTAEITATLEGTSSSAKTIITIKPVATAPGTGVLTVTIAGLERANAAVTVTGPNGFNEKPTATKTFSDLPPGKYDIAAQEVVMGADKYQPDKTAQTVNLLAGQTLEAKINYSLATLYVNPMTGADTNSGAKDKPFKTITKALAQAVAGQTVRLASEVYGVSTGEAFPLRPKSGVSIEGETFPGVVIAGSGSCLRLEDVQDVQLLKIGLQCDISLWLQNASNITVAELNSASKDVGIVAYNSAVTLDEVQIYNSSQEGLSSQGTSQIILTNSKLFRNQFGARLEGSSQLTANNSSFTENTSAGIFVRETASLVLENSNADFNGATPGSGSGLAVNSTGDGVITIKNTTFSNNQGDGIRLHTAFGGTNFFDVTITNSTFLNNLYGLTTGDARGVIELRKNLFGGNTNFQISDGRPDNVPLTIYALETTIDDGMGSYQLSGLKTGKNKDSKVWEITGTGNKLCFDTSCVP